MKITVLCVGKIKESYWKAALAEYQKRLSRYCKLELVEVADEKTPDNASAAQTEEILKREADRLLKHIGERACVLALEIAGQRLDSAAFAHVIEQQGIQGESSLIFVIGGSLGLHGSVLERSNIRLSFSDMTFPHQLMRVILLEQIYRGYRIINGEPYHK